MGLLSFLATTALLFIGATGLFGTTPMAPVQAQTLSDPLDATTLVDSGTAFYVYNPPTQTIVSPATSGNGLVLIPWQDYDNTTMQWTLNTYDPHTGSAYISAAIPANLGCPAGLVHWSAPTVAPVVTLCTPTVSVYESFFFLPTNGINAYNIQAFQNGGGCVADTNGVLTTPRGVCDVFGRYTKWQFVTISPPYYY